MPNTQRNYVRSGSVFYKLVEGVQEVRAGCLLKSPPSKKFKSLRSWKRRFFVLFRINEKEHALKYFRSSDDRDKPLGGIEISQISMIFSSPQSNSKWTWIHKTFKCNPDSVLFIRTCRRDYFLIDENNDNVEGWFQDISKILLSRTESKLNSEMLTQLTAKPMVADGSSQGSELCHWLKQGSELCYGGKEGSGRSFSDPVHPLNVSHNAPQNCIEDKGQEKSRPISDPLLDLSRVKISQDTPLHFGSDTGNDKFHPISDNVYEEYKFNLRRCSSVDSSSSDQSTSEPFGTNSPEPIYDTPRNLLKRWSQDSTDIEDENQNEEEATSFYMKMDALYEVLNMGQEGSEEIPAANSCPEEKPQLPVPPAERTKVSPAHMLLNWAKNKSFPSNRLEPQNHSCNSDRDTADVREITVNQNDLKTHLTLVEVNGKPCISNWPALPETKCLFRKGDQILAINDLRIESMEEVQTYLNKVLKDQVKLTVLRQPGSEASLPSRWGTESTVE
ncbi:pleckstrin homology domain-containing family S member 1-like isoform X2 [Anguilla anguilla]|uniref:pleckstrin homology domain-containing family S member 1-like isoform X2 n=1 Tax=Anguilla anguilla TaxID=7936 RepID=UPI0015B0DA5D|nr:pleckstrin homology domain-containing family S member 1-like isoform X2 [Anguilla anguilla]